MICPKNVCQSECRWSPSHPGYKASSLGSERSFQEREKERKRERKKKRERRERERVVKMSPEIFVGHLQEYSGTLHL